MKQKLISLLTVIGLVASISLVIAKPNFVQVTNPAGKTFSLPENAVEVVPGVFSLGYAFDSSGKLVEGYAFIDYKNAHGKPTGCNDDGVCQGWEDASCGDCSGNGDGGDDDSSSDTSSCYGFLAKKAKWKNIESWIVNPSNTQGLTDTFILTNLATNILKWEDVGNADILGEGSSTSEGLIADTESPDNKNEVYFADIDSPEAIGVTIVWGVFSGPPFNRELVEWDMIFDDTDFDWSEDAEGSVAEMDFENIATHELGHAVGLADLYDDKCSEMTMYGYAIYGETKKRSLENGDINGVKELYK